MQSSVNERIKFLVEKLEKGNQTAFANKIGVRAGTISDMVAGRLNKPSFDVLNKIATAYPPVSTNWLLVGVGSWFKSKEEWDKWTNRKEDDTISINDLRPVNSQIVDQNLLSEEYREINKRVIEVFLKSNWADKPKGELNFSKEIGLALSDFEKIKRNEITTPISAIIELSKIYNLPLGWLLNGKETSENTTLLSDAFKQHALYTGDKKGNIVSLEAPTQEELFLKVVDKLMEYSNKMEVLREEKEKLNTMIEQLFNDMLTLGNEKVMLEDRIKELETELRKYKKDNSTKDSEPGSK